MIHTFEHVIQLMGPRQEQQSWVWISDFNGFGLRNLNPAIALHANKLFSTYYAERLGCFMLLGAPRLFSGLYNVLTPVLDPTTKQKLLFVDRTEAAMRQAFASLFDDELSQWLMMEVTHNDTNSIRQRKRYADTPARKATTDWATEVPFVRQGAEIDGHNMHGTPSFLKLLNTMETPWQKTFFHCQPTNDAA